MGQEWDFALVDGSEKELDSVSAERVVAQAAGWAERLKGMVADTTDLLLDAAEQDRRIHGEEHGDHDPGPHRHAGLAALPGLHELWYCGGLGS